MLSRKVATTIASVMMLSSMMTTMVSQRSQSQTVPYTVRFFCGQDASGTPATLVERSNRSKAPAAIIRWTSNYFSDAGYRPWTRCQMVSNKFQAAYNRNPNFLFTYSYLNREPVICAADVRGGRCMTMLYTVKRGMQDPIVTMLRLDQVRVGAAGALNESTGGPLPESNYVSVQEMLKQQLGDPAVINTAATPTPVTTAEQTTMW